MTDLGKVVFRFANLAGTSTTLALLGTVADAMASLATKVAGDVDSLTAHLLLGTSFAQMSDFAAVVALVHTTIKRGARIGKTGEILLGRSRPLVNQNRTVGFVGEEVANGILLAGFALKVDIGPGVAMIFLLQAKSACVEVRKQPESLPLQ